MLDAISPLDGRYASATAPLREFFSEFALIRARAHIELRYLLEFDSTGVFPRLTAEERMRIEALEISFAADDADKVKAAEKITRHDVKALEFFLRDRLSLAAPNRIHFGLTSEDVNNLAYGILLDSFVRTVQRPAMKNLLGKLIEICEGGAAQPFPTRTHGQAASPSTAGKELAVYIERFRRLGEKLVNVRFMGKCNGATGTWASWNAADPSLDWPGFFERFVAGLGLDFNPVTTQIEDHDSWAAYFNLVRQCNNVLIDLDQDIWLWLMEGWYCEEAAAGEIGSSTMPHKVNPIRFENSEGNLLLANALLGFFSDKLCRSRLQRDLSDSTVSRNIGVALGHSYLGFIETTHGLERLRLRPERCIQDLERHLELLAEPVQTILRPAIQADPYVLLKELTRGKNFSRADLERFIAGLEVTSEVSVKLLNLTVSGYIGLAERICREELERARAFLKTL